MAEFKILSNPELKSILKRKLEEVVSPISSQLSLDKKPKKIHCEHRILNDDCLGEIFTYIPICERQKVALVCKQWNRVFHSNWYRVKRLEFPHRNIYGDFEEPNGLLFIKSLIHNCGLYLTELDLIAYNNSDIVPVVKESCPNLVKLRLRFRYYTSKDLENAFSRMSELKILKIIFQYTDEIPVAVIDSLKDVANTLSELTLAHWNGYLRAAILFPVSFRGIISRFKNLQRLEIIGLRMAYLLYESIKNAKLNRFIDNYQGFCKQLPDKFILSYNLDVMNYELTDDDLYVFVNHVHFLMLIKAFSTHITDVGIHTITKIKNLKYLHLHGANQHITDSSIKLLKNLEKLHLPYTNKITNASVLKVLENSPNMRWLSIMYTSATPEFLKKASEIASKRGKYLTLCIRFDKNIYFLQVYQLPYLKINHHGKTAQIGSKKICECLLQRESIVNN